MKVSKLIFLFLMGIMLGKAQTKKQMNDQTIYQFEVEEKRYHCQAYKARK